MQRASRPSLVARVRRTLEQRSMLDRGRSILVAVSGGPDSIAMLDALDRLSSDLGLTLSVASVDHGLRPEARDEVRFVGEAASARGLRFAPLALGLEAGSTHAVARAARYDALLSAARELGASSVAVGHTRDDQAETVLARILRGSGIRGLRGIRPTRADGVIRPLIDVRRADVREHLDRHRLASVEDPSNHDRRHLRVRVRHELVPRLELESSEVTSHLAALADEAGVIADFADGIATEFRSSCGGRLELVALERLPAPARSAAISEFVRFHTGREPGRRVVESVAAALESGGSVLIGGGLALEGVSGSLDLRRVDTRLQRSTGPRRPRK